MKFAGGLSIYLHTLQQEVCDSAVWCRALFPRLFQRSGLRRAPCCSDRTLYAHAESVCQEFILNVCGSHHSVLQGSVSLAPVLAKLSAPRNFSAIAIF